MKYEPYPTEDGGKAFPAECYTQSFTVPFDYPVYFTNDIFHTQNDLLASVIDRKNERR